jgi:hypothetical protein
LITALKKINFYYFNEEGNFSEKNIIKKLNYDINKFFNKNVVFKIKEMNFDKNDNYDKELFDNIKLILIPIVQEFEEFNF